MEQLVIRQFSELFTTVEKNIPSKGTWMSTLTASVCVCATALLYCRFDIQ